MENNWTEICAQCMDGDIEPKHCEYYGEPNGCNSPIYGEHPTAENLSVAGNAAAILEALSDIIDKIDKWRTDGSMEHWQYSQLFDIADAALAAPARNCNRFKTKEEAAIAFANEKKQWIPQQVLWELAPWLDWLFATTKEGGEE